MAIKSKHSRFISGSKKEDTVKFLRALQSNLSGSIKTIDPLGSQTFKRSPVHLDYSISAIQKEVRLDIKFKRRKKAKGRREVQAANTPGNTEYNDYLAKNFNKWVREGLLKSIPRGTVTAKSEDDFWDRVKLHSYIDPKTGAPGLRKITRGDKRFKDKEALKTVIFHDVGKSLFLYYSPSAEDQKNSFRDSVLLKLKNYAKKEVARLSRNKNLKEEAFYYKYYFAWIQSIHLGHTYGLKASQVGRVLDFGNSKSLARGIKEHNINLKDVTSSPSATLARGIARTLVSRLRIDINVSVEKNFTPRKDGYIQGLTLEFGPDNSESGEKLKAAINHFCKIQIEEAIEELNKSGKTKVDKLLRILSSDTSEELIFNSIIDTFVGKKPKSYKGKKDAKGNVKHTVSSKKSTHKVNLGAKIIAELEAASDNSDLNSKIPFLNRRLHDKIQQNMGKGRSKKILNYRTGRFARSVEIEQFMPSREKGAVNAQVRYMRNPYGVFEPGGRLATTPGRNPNRIIRRSIRQLLQEEKIANFRRVVVDLHG